MRSEDVMQLLSQKVGELRANIPIEWRYPDAPPKNPVHARIRSSWKKIEPGQGGVMNPDRTLGPKKDHKGRCWFYADIVFPKEIAGVPLKGEQGLFFVGGWAPFTLWIDGKQAFEETHAWHATGPIVDPVVQDIEPGRVYRIAMAVGPDHVSKFRGVSLSIQIGKGLDLAVELSAAAAQLRMARYLAKTPSERRLVERGASCIDVKALGANQYEKAIASIPAMEKALAPLSPRAKEITVHLIGHTHIDMDWLWTWDDTVHCIRRDVKAVTDIMDDIPDATFTCPQIPIYEVTRDMDPDLFKKIQKYVAEGRWDCAAARWVEGDLNMADGESIARHFLYATDWTKKHLGTQSRVVWEPDTFGHPSNMPQLARLGECDIYFHFRCPPRKDGRDIPIRKWTGIDGSSVTAFSQIYIGSLEPNAVVGEAISYFETTGRKNAFSVWGAGDHGGALSRMQIDFLNRYRDKPLMPTVKFSTMPELTDAVLKEKTPLPENVGETHTVFEGCYTTHSDIKKSNRDGENALLEAEALCALAGIDRRDALRNAWTPILFSQFHDIFDGCAVPKSYDDAAKRAKKSIATARRAAREAMAVLAAPAKRPQTLTLVNPLGFERNEPVTVSLPKGTKCLIDEAGVALPVQKKGSKFVFVARAIPAFGRKTYAIRTSVPKGVAFPEVAVQGAEGRGGHTPGSIAIDTNHARVQVCGESGVFSSFFDKSLGFDLVSQNGSGYGTGGVGTRKDLGMNVFQVIDEQGSGGTAWVIANIRSEQNLLTGAKVEVVDAGPVFARVRVVHAVRKSRIEEEIVFYQDDPRVDFQADIDWRELGNAKKGVPQLKVSFASNVRAARARTEGPFSVAERAANGQEMPTLKWADLLGDDFGFALYNDSKYGCDALGGRMRLTLLRSSYVPDPDSDRGRHTIRFAFEPHAAGLPAAPLMRNGMAFNRPCAATLTADKPRAAKPQLVMEGADSVVCTALRRAEHSDALLVRFFETSGEPCRFRFTLGKGIRFAREVNFLENPTAPAARVNKGKVSAAFRGFEVKTFLVECVGDRLSA